MTDEEWAKGMAELVGQPWPSWGDDTPERKAIRGVTYRRELDGLSGDLWLSAVQLAIQRERRFPPVAVLLEYAKEAAGAPRMMAALPAGAACEHCDGTGWERVEVDTRSDGQPLKHTAVRKCRCRMAQVSA